jgi:RNA polymerase primary sigma factor
MSATTSTTRYSGVNLASYLEATHAYDLLSPTEERALSEAIGRGDEEARSRMIQANLRLVVRIAREFAGRGLPFEDLVSEGNLGLIRAVRDYDPVYGTRFSTYASHWIKQSIRHALLNTEPAIRLPAHMAGLLTRWKRARKALRVELNREPSTEEIADRLGLSRMQRSMVGEALRARGLRSNSDLSDHQSGVRLDRGRDSDLYPTSNEEVEIAEERDAIIRRLERLDARERDVIRLRFGLAGDPAMTFKQIGCHLRMTREGARKVVTRALAKLGGTIPRERFATTGTSPRSPDGWRSVTVRCDRSGATEIVSREASTAPRLPSQRSAREAKLACESPLIPSSNHRHDPKEERDGQGGRGVNDFGQVRGQLRNARRSTDGHDIG